MKTLAAGRLALTLTDAISDTHDRIDLLSLRSKEMSNIVPEPAPRSLGWTTMSTGACAVECSIRPIILNRKNAPENDACEASRIPYSTISAMPGVDP